MVANVVSSCSKQGMVANVVPSCSNQGIVANVVPSCSKQVMVANVVPILQPVKELSGALVVPFFRAKRERHHQHPPPAT